MEVKKPNTIFSHFSWQFHPMNSNHEKVN